MPTPRTDKKKKKAPPAPKKKRKRDIEVMPEPLIVNTELVDDLRAARASGWSTVFRDREDPNDPRNKDPKTDGVWIKRKKVKYKIMDV